MWLTTAEVVELLGIVSEKTVQNWIETERFPGSLRGPNGWRFSQPEVMRVKAELERIRSVNTSGDISPPDFDSDNDTPIF